MSANLAAEHSVARAATSGLGPGIIAALIRDASGKPLAGVQVVASGPTVREATTGAGGYVTLQALPLGTYTVRATRGGYDPLERTVLVHSLTAGFKVLDLRLAAVSFVPLKAGAENIVAREPLGSGDPNVAHALGQIPAVALVPGSLGGGASLLGTGLGESRFTLDGIPLAGGGTATALRARNALAYNQIEVVTGPLSESLSVRDALGGTVNYRTPSLEGPGRVALAAGYDANFGNYQVLNVSQTSGAFGASLAAVTGGGANRSQVFKAAYALSPSTAVGVAVYGSQSSAGNGAPAVDAPAYAFDFRTAVDSGTLRVRSYGSALNADPESDRLRGTQVAYSVPVGDEVLSAGYERDVETLVLGNSTLEQSYSSLALRGETPLGARLRLSLADVFSQGSGLAPRADPQVGLAYRAGERLTLQASAGSAFATAPLVPQNPAAPALARPPETAFAYQFAANARLGSLDTLTFAATRIALFDRFAPKGDTRNTGLTLGFAHAPNAQGFSLSAYASLLHAAALAGEGAPAGQLPGLPSASGRLEVAYRTKSGLGFGLGASYYGPNNGLGGGATLLTDVSAALPLGNLAGAQFGVRNLFARAVPPYATYLYGGPNQFSLSLGRNFGRQ